MKFVRYAMHGLTRGVSLVVGVTLISFVLMVYFGPDPSYEIAGKNPTPQQLQEIRHQLGYDRSFATRYLEYLGQLVSGDFGHSDSTGERVDTILLRTIPISLAVMLPGFVLGNLLAIALALAAAWARGRWLDRLTMGIATLGMSISFLVVVIGFQMIFSSSYGLNWFPVRGWNASSLTNYFRYAAVPTLALVFVALGYNTRFYRALIVEELNRDHVRTARAFGLSDARIMMHHVLKNTLVSIVTRVMFSVPLLIIGGSLLIESYFGIPGVGKVTFDAITTGDQPVLKAVVSLGALLFLIVMALTDFLYRVADPRVHAK